MSIEYKWIQFRRAVAATWASLNPVLKAGEPGYAQGTGVKIGDGSTAWNSLPFLATLTDLAGKVSKSGDTMTGNLVLAPASGGISEIFNVPVGQREGLIFRKNGLDRFLLHCAEDAETGGNDGSFFDLWWCNDAGTAQGLVFRVYRTNGRVGFFQSPDVPDLQNQANGYEAINSRWVNTAWRSKSTLLLNPTYYYRSGANTVDIAASNGAVWGGVFTAGRTCTINRIAARVNNAGSSGAVLRMALVEVTNPDTRAWTLVADLGTVSATTTGVKELTGSMPVVQGRQYAPLVISQGGAGTQPNMRFAVNTDHTGGAASSADAIDQGSSGIFLTGITGAIPASGTATPSAIQISAAVRADA